MALKSLDITLDIKPVVVTNESIGTGNDLEQTFNLTHTNIRSGTLIVKFNGTPTDSYTANLLEGTVTATPSTGVAVTVDYISGNDTLLIKAPSDKTIIIFTLSSANIDDTDDSTLTLYRIKNGGSIKYFAKDYNIPVHSAYKPLSGTIVLEANDELHAYSSAINSIDINMEYKI